MITLKSCLAFGLATTALCASAYEAKTESRAYFATNPDKGVGKAATITIDGNFNDWTEAHMIARNGANNVATAFKGSHENNVLDIYAVYGAWDDMNVYIAWQMCNTGDVWARPGDGPLTDYGKPGNIPLIVALSVDPSKPGMTGKLEDGRCIWIDNAGSGTQFDPEQVHVDHLLFMSAQVNQGVPAIFTAVNAKGDTNYGAGCTEFTSAGVKYSRGDGFLPSALWRCGSYAEWYTPTEIKSDPSIVDDIYDITKYDNIINNDVAGLQPHDTDYDTFFEIAIPMKALGITREWLEANGIGVRVIGTRGESALDCCPFDPAMMDNALGEYGKDPSTTHEKDDIDVITYAMADLGKIRDLSNIEPTPDPTPDPDPDPTPNPDPTPDPVPDGDYVAYFKGDNFGTPYAYVWDKGNGDLQLSGAWPGTRTQSVTISGNVYYRHTFTAASAPVKPMIIFNNGSGGSGNQTGDLEFVNHGIYTASGFTGELLDELTSVAEINTADDASALYFDLLGRQLPTAPEKGIFIKVAGGKAVKIAK